MATARKGPTGLLLSRGRSAGPNHSSRAVILRSGGCLDSSRAAVLHIIADKVEGGHGDKDVGLPGMLLPRQYLIRRPTSAVPLIGYALRTRARWSIKQLHP